MMSEILLRVTPGLLCAHWERSLLVTDDRGMLGEGMQGLYEHDLCGSSWIVIVGIKLFPGMDDRYMARTGYQSQMRDEPADLDQPNDLYHAADADRDYGAHGVFTERSHGRSYEIWGVEHRPGVLAVVLGLVLAGTITLFTKLR